MISTLLRGATCAAVLSLVLSGCGGGSGDGGGPAFTLISVTPNTSATVNGGETVTVRGTNFRRASVANVVFGGQVAFNLNVLSENELTVRTPPAPGRLPGLVAVEAFSSNPEVVGQVLQDAYEYVDAQAGPMPVSIFPTSYSPTATESFTIQGSNLGPGGGTIDVIFAGIATVTANVSNDSTVVTGRMPFVAGTPPAGPITVTVDTGSETADVPTSVRFDYAAPSTLAVPSQAAGGASQPVTLAPGIAVLCTAGANGTWRDSDDEVVIIQGPPSVVSSASFVRRAGNVPIGFLDAQNSIPAVLDINTICVLSVGGDGTPTTNDDLIVQITSARATPVVTDHGALFLNTAPLVRISDTRVAGTTAGPNGTLGNNDDALLIFEFSGTTVVGGGLASNLGALDTTPGRGNLSLPFTADGDSIFVYTAGTNATFGDTNDALNRVLMPGLQQISTAAANLAGRPLAFSGTLAGAPGAGPNGTFGNSDDQLVLFSIVSSAFNLTTHTLPTPFSTTPAAGPFVPFAPFGTGGILVPLVGTDGAPNTIDDRLSAYTDPLAGTVAGITFPGTPLLTTLGDGGLIVYGKGTNLIAGDGDDQTQWINGTATLAQNFQTKLAWGQAVPGLADLNRAFSVGPGPNGTRGDADDQLLVHPSLAVGDFPDASALPLALAGATVPATLPFVPIGPRFGLAQSPGPNGTFGNADDVLLLVRY